MPKALVTGATGFIGSHLVGELLKREYEVNCLVRHTSNLASLQEQLALSQEQLAPSHGLPVTLFIGDVREPETLIQPIKDVDYVCHLAAELMVTSEQAFRETNTDGTINLLNAAERHAKTSLKRFLFVSSQAAAGPGQDENPIDETTEPRPISWYGKSKKEAEDAVQDFSDRLPTTIVRPSAVYGERETDISQAFPLVSRRLHPQLGLKTKHAVMVYVGDLVQGIVDAAESQNTLNEVYFLNHPERLTSLEVTKTTAKAMGKPWGVTIPTPIFLLRLAAPVAEFLHHITRNRPQVTQDKARELGYQFWVTDPSKANRDFGWTAQQDLLSGMKITTQAYFAAKRQIQKMPLETPRLLWTKYVCCASVIGALIETTSALGGFYTFDPAWLVWIVIFGAFGLVLGTTAMVLRTRSLIWQIVIGTALAGGAELLVSFEVFSVGWTFADGWPLGITNEWLRSGLLGLAGGIFVVVVNTLMQELYKRRLRLG